VSRFQPPTFKVNGQGPCLYMHVSGGDWARLPPWNSTDGSRTWVESQGDLEV